MKLRSLLLVSIGLVIACGAVINVAEVSEATPKDKFFCAVLEGTPRTFVRTEIKTIKVLSWVRQFSGGWTPIKRCVEVSKRFQRFLDNDTLKFIGAGDINNQPVLCAVVQKGDRCNNANMLLTLPTGEDAALSAQKLLDTRGLASGRQIYVSGGDNNKKLETYSNGQTYYDLDVIQDIAPAVTEKLTPVEDPP